MKFFLLLVAFFIVSPLFAQSEWIRENYTKVEYDIAMRDGPSCTPSFTHPRMPLLLKRTRF